MMMTELTAKQKRFLRQRAHHDKPVVIVAARGLTDSVQAEIDRALTDHELIKIRLRVGDRDARDRALDEIRSSLDAALVQRIGHVAVLYRPHPEGAKLSLP